MTNSVEPDKTARYSNEPSQQDIHCLHRYLTWSAGRAEMVSLCFTFCLVLQSNELYTPQSLITADSLFRTRLSQITAYLQLKILSLTKHANLTTGKKYCGKEEKLLIFSTIFSIYLQIQEFNYI